MSKIWSNAKGSFKKHLYRMHKCKCGKEIKGNAYYNHRKHCKVYQKMKHLDNELGAVEVE